jgi:leader peptidase (prepilin peptidase)/N-methyltransferase
VADGVDVHGLSDAELVKLRSEQTKRYVKTALTLIGTFIVWFVSIGMLIQALHLKNAEGGSTSWKWLLPASFFVWLYSLAGWLVTSSQRRKMRREGGDVGKELQRREADSEQAQRNAKREEKREEKSRSSQLIALAVTERLHELAVLKEQGLLEEAEFAALKAKLLASDQDASPPPAGTPVTPPPAGAGTSPLAGAGPAAVWGDGSSSAKSVNPDDASFELAAEKRAERAAQKQRQPSTAPAMTTSAAAVTWALRPVRLALVVAASWAGAAWVFGVGWRAAAYSIAFAVIVVISLVNRKTLTVPNRLLVLGTAITTTAFVIAAAPLHAGDDAVRALLAGSALFAVYFTVELVSSGVGMGCVKFAFVVGLPLGFQSWAAVGAGFGLAFALGAVKGVVLTRLRGVGRESQTSFADLMAAAAVITILASG